MLREHRVFARTALSLVAGIVVTAGVASQALADEAPPPAMTGQLAPLPQAAPPVPAQVPLQAQPAPQVIIIQQPAPPTPPPAPVYVQQQPSPYYVPQGGAEAVPLRPRVLRNWDESQPIPLGYHQEDHVRTGLVIGGAVTFGTMYLLTAFGASIANDTGSSVGALYVPVFGPFIEMTKTSSSTAAFWLAVDGVVQIGGVAMFVAGIALPRTEIVRNDAFELRLAPILAKDQTGMGVVGRF